MSQIENEIRYSINNLISRQITKETIIQPEIMKKLKTLLKKSDHHVKVAFDQILLQMETPNSTRFIELWNEAYGNLYPKIALGYTYVKEVLKVEFPDVFRTNQEEDLREIERQRQKQQILNVKFSRIKREYEEYHPNMTMMIKQMDICFKIVVPDLTAPEEDSWKNLDDDEILESVDTTTTETLTIDLSNPFGDLKNKDNKEIFDILSDGMTEIQFQFLPMVKEWCKVCTEVVLEEFEKKSQQKILKHAIRFKSQMQPCMEKCKQLKIEPKPTLKRKLIEKPVPKKKIGEIKLI